MSTQPNNDQEMFYIQDTRTYTGNAIVWWGINGRGYTSDIKKAGRYTREEAAKICERETDRAWPCDYIDNNHEAHVTIIDVQYVKKSYSGLNNNLQPLNHE